MGDAALKAARLPNADNIVKASNVFNLAGEMIDPGDAGTIDSVGCRVRGAASFLDMGGDSISYSRKPWRAVGSLWGRRKL